MEQLRHSIPPIPQQTHWLRRLPHFFDDLQPAAGCLSRSSLSQRCSAPLPHFGCFETTCSGTMTVVGSDHAAHTEPLSVGHNGGVDWSGYHQRRFRGPRRTGSTDGRARTTRKYRASHQSLCHASRRLSHLQLNNATCKRQCCNFQSNFLNSVSSMRTEDMPAITPVTTDTAPAPGLQAPSAGGD